MSTLVASTVKTNTIQNTSGASSSTADQLNQGRAKVWCSFNGVTPAIKDSFNVSSLTDNGTGNYDVNFSSNMSNNNYAVSLTTGDGTYGSQIPYGLFFTLGGYSQTSSVTNSSVRVYQISYAGGVYDALHNHVVVFGDT